MSRESVDTYPTPLLPWKGFRFHQVWKQDIQEKMCDKSASYVWSVYC